MSRSPMRSQQAPWQSASKRQILDAWRDDKAGPEPEIDGSNEEHVKVLFEDLQGKFDRIVSLLKADLVDNKLQQEEALSAGLMKLPKSVRQMTVKDFNRANNCDILSVLKSKDGVQPSALRKRDHTGTVAETPALKTRPNLSIPASIMRTARRGEGLYSKNGSPVAACDVGAVVATVTKKRRGNDTANIEINVGDGRYISLNDPTGVEGLDSSTKKTAASQLLVLQDQMASLMAQLTK